MAAAGFLALLMNRKILTIRNAALVFGLMILMNPFWLVTAGFQLSFSAVIGLVYFFGKYPPKGSKVWKFFYIVIMTDFISTVWTAPFILYHFGNFPVYTLLGNLVLLPVFSIGIMPLILLGTVTAFLFGWRFPFVISDKLYDFVVWFSDWVASLPYAMVPFPEITGFALYLSFTGFFLFIINKRRLGCAAVAAAIVWTMAQPMPILRTTYDNEVVSFTQDSKTTFNTTFSAKHRFVIPRGGERHEDCRFGFCRFETENWTAVSFRRLGVLHRHLHRLCDYDFVISYLPLELPDCPEKVIRGGVRIYRDGTVRQFTPRIFGN
jgi:hypothetical protein